MRSQTPHLKPPAKNLPSAHLLVDHRQELEEPLLAVGRQHGEGVLVDDRPQVGVHQDGVRRLHVYLTLSALELPWEAKQTAMSSGTIRGCVRYAGIGCGLSSCLVIC